MHELQFGHMLALSIFAGLITGGEAQTWANVTSTDSKSSGSQPSSRLSLGTGVHRTTNSSSYPVPTAGPSASSCNVARLNWVNNKGRSIASNSTYFTTTTATLSSYTTNSINETFLSPHATEYTCADGWPRLQGHTVLDLGTTEVFKEITSSFTTTSAVLTPAPKPKCTINSSDCSGLLDVYSSAFQSYENTLGQASTAVGATTTAAPPQSPLCNDEDVQWTSIGPAECAYADATIKLYYWPVTPATIDTCGGTFRSTITATQTIPGQANTFKTLNTTFTSPTVYMSFEGLWTYTKSGTEYPNSATLIFPQAADAVSSYRYSLGGGRGSALPINYADFNFPAPVDAYRAQYKCFHDTNSLLATVVTDPEPNAFTTYIGTSYTQINKNYCSTILDDYAPALKVPKELYNIGLTGADGDQCMFKPNDDYGVLYDPPIALRPVESIQGPTLPGSHPTPVHTGSKRPSATAEPVHAPEPTTARNTSPPQPTQTQGVQPPQNTPQPTHDDNGDEGSSPTTTGGLGGFIASLFSVANGGHPTPPSDTNTPNGNNVETVFTAAGTTFAVSGTEPVTIDPTHVLAPGGSAITIGDQTISLDAAGTQLVVNGVTQTASNVRSASGGATSSAVGSSSPSSSISSPSSSGGTSNAGSALSVVFAASLSLVISCSLGILSLI